MTTTSKLALLAALMVSEAASAKVYIELRPRASLMAGYDDNVQLDGSGADSFGQAAPGLKLDLFGEHQLHLDVDCQAGLAHLTHPEQFGISSGAFATSEQCLTGFRTHLSERTRMKFNLRASYAQDPFAISGFGLLLRAGQTQVFAGRFSSEVEHSLDPRSEVDFGFDAQALAFGANDPGNGYSLAPGVRYVHRLTERSTWDVGVREQLFFAVGATPGPLTKTGVPAGLLDEGHAALIGYTYKLLPYADLIVRGGPLYMTGQHGQTLFPVARLEIESITPSTGIHLTVAHDLVIGATAAGPLVGDIAELGVMYDWGRFSGHARGGVYRNAGLAETGVGAMGYGAEVAVDYALTREVKIGVAGLRDARLNDFTTGQRVDRDVVQLRLTWERARFE